MTKVMKKPDSFGSPFVPASLVQYQAGSIVSRILLDSRRGSITLFAFDQGESLSEHAAPFDALVQILEGEAEIVLSGKSHSMKSGEALVMPASAPHAVRALRRFKMLLTLLKRGS